MKLSGSTALITGANRGIGRHFVDQLHERGARKIYATARTPQPIDLPGVEVLPLDITDPGSIAAVAERSGDVDLLINNAGITTHQPLVSGDLDEIRREMETHYYGTLGTIRAFAPILAANGGGAIVNLLSVLSWRPFLGAGGYAAGKAAAWSLTNSVRLELAGQGTLVTGVHVGAVDTDMMAGWDVPKVDPAELVRIVLDGIEHDELEILVDEPAAAAKAAVAGDVRAAFPELG
ncbi:SDR family oxidoreductase [Kribbella italica]|uniref:NAD(P)-dependent dehydrogenase (Short-subunit alcohol dehydrogenase family) n=1 Tax=Kribbella italica TaxID=1540520 RepID=A0A7W9J3M9_9ACTN|nr:NAD(P)-dependent dehydrogenase (short-subunit alcohol dehydrogenase family) [Kribbella italica]